MGNFFGCPARWRFDKGKWVVVRTDMSALYFGRDVHKAVSNYYEEMKNYLGITRKGVAEAIQRHMDEVEGDQKRIDKIVKHLTTYEIGRAQKYGVENMAPLYIEKRFDVAPFKGVIDLVHRTDKENEVIVVDWKTGKYRPDEWMNIQMSIYSYFMEKENLKVRNAYGYFLEHGMMPQATIDIPGAVTKANTFFKRTENPDYHYPKNKTFLCKWCGHQLHCLYEEAPSIFKVETISTFETIQNRGMVHLYA